MCRVEIGAWCRREFAKSVECFILGLTFVAVFGDPLLTGRVRWLGRWLGSITVHAPKDKGESAEQDSSMGGVPRGISGEPCRLRL